MNTYTRKKKRFLKLMASVSSLPIANNARRRMAKKGVCPPGWNVHHVMPRCQGGRDRIENFSLIKITDHEKLTDDMNHILESCDGFTDEDRPYLKVFAEQHGAFLLPGGKMDYNA